MDESGQKGWRTGGRRRAEEGAKSAAKTGGTVALQALAPYIIIGGAAILALGIIEAKFDVMGNTAAAKAKADELIKEDYAERVYTIDATEAQRAVQTGDITAADPERVRDLIGPGVNVMTAEELDLWAKDPVAYMDAYGKAHGWEV